MQNRFTALVFSSVLYEKKISTIVIVILLLCASAILIYSLIYYVWEQYNNHLFEEKGEIVIATIVKKEGGGVIYDIEYNGTYYCNWTSVSKSLLREIRVGEHFHALILPDLLKYHHNNGITPRYTKIILLPLSPCEQDYEAELKRINVQYGY